MIDHRIIVIAASIGGIEALLTLVEMLPSDFRAPVLIVQHIAPTSRGFLPGLLSSRSKFPVMHAQEQQPIDKGVIYVAPPDQHMLVEDRHIMLSRGPKENHTRPAADPLFRSAAVAYGPGAIGVVLTGHLDNGAAGLAAIQRHGGTAIVQSDAIAPSMPIHALAHVPQAQVVPLRDIPALLAWLALDPPQGTGGSRLEGLTDLDRAELAIARGEGISPEIAKTVLAKAAVRAIRSQTTIAMRLAGSLPETQAAEARFLREMARALEVQTEQTSKALQLVSELIEPEPRVVQGQDRVIPMHG
jgi:CheB methylesterase